LTALASIAYNDDKQEDIGSRRAETQAAPRFPQIRGENAMPEYKPLQEKAYEYLQKQIADGKLEPNVIYSETKIAAEIGLSRTPVKDALVRLSQDKYIDIIPSKGFCLHIMTEEDVWCTYQTRTAIESFCALNLHACRGTDEGASVIHRLGSSIRAMEQAIHDGEKDATVLAHDLNFHHTLVRFSRNPEMIQLFESYNHRLYDIAMQSFGKPGRKEEALAEHKRIYDYICSEEPGIEGKLYLEVAYHMIASRDIALEYHNKT
jgi:DNA-binding GntR family transcriptional regulator